MIVAYLPHTKAGFSYLSAFISEWIKVLLHVVDSFSGFNQDESVLIWYSGKKEKQLKLSQVTRIIPGQRTVSVLHIWVSKFCGYMCVLN